MDKVGERRIEEEIITLLPKPEEWLAIFDINSCSNKVQEEKGASLFCPTRWKREKNTWENGTEMLKIPPALCKWSVANWLCLSVCLHGIGSIQYSSPRTLNFVKPKSYFLFSGAGKWENAASKANGEGDREIEREREGGRERERGREKEGGRERERITSS
jgi:hypothetical protein